MDTEITATNITTLDRVLHTSNIIIMNSVLSWKDSGKFLHDDGKCTCRKKVLLQHRMFKMSDCLRLSVDIDGIPDALTLTVYAPAFHGKVRVTVTFPSIHLEKESLDTFTKCLVELNEIAGTLEHRFRNLVIVG
jgi:hypothetical protein